MITVDDLRRPKKAKPVVMSKIRPRGLRQSVSKASPFLNIHIIGLEILGLEQHLTTDVDPCVSAVNN